MSAADAVAAATEIERRGYAFYRRVMEKAADAQDKDFFAFMAEEEKRHEGIFASMLERLGGVSLPAGSDDEEYLQYVRGLIDSHILFMPGQEKRALASPLHEAMQFEKDTLIFSFELERMVSNSKKRDVRNCAEEERKHLRMLIKRLR